MVERLKRYLMQNKGLKATALLLAVVVWAAITGRERAHMELTIDLPVDPIGVPADIEVRSVRPQTVRATLSGPVKALSGVTPGSLGIRIDLGGMQDSNKFNFYSEDHLFLPAGVHVVSIHPKMIEIVLEQMVDKEVPVKAALAGQPIRGRRLAEVSVQPERVTVKVFKSQYSHVHAVSTEEINLAAINRSTTLRVPLRQVRDVLRFRDVREVEVRLLLEEKR